MKPVWRKCITVSASLTASRITDPKGPITFTPRNLHTTAGQDVAFVACDVHCDGTSAGPLDLRLTVGLEKRHGAWIVTHEHHSVPTVEDKFIES